MISVLAVAACVLLFSFAIFIHEFGHFLAARLLGFRVETFSIGFGPALWKRRVGGVEYRISAIPFGGYVALPELDPAGTKALESGADKGGEGGAGVEQAPAWKRVVVAFAGPFGNFVLAAVLALGLAAAPGAKFGEVPAVIGSVHPGGPAQEAGLIENDRVAAINGNEVRTWSEMQTEVQLAGEKAAEFLVERGGTNVTLSVKARRDEVTGMCYILAFSTTNGVVKASPWMPARNPLKQLAWDAGQIARVLKALTTPGESKAAAKALGGPVMIAEGLYNQVRHNGWDAIGFLRFLNVNLGMLNLLPIPVLDGGLILFALFELLFRRKPPKKLTDGLSMVFMWLFLGLMVFLVFRDVNRSRRIRAATEEYERRSEALKNAEPFRPAFDLPGASGGAEGK